MATYPVKMLKDEEGKPFVPLISIDSIKEVGGETLEQQLDKKLETTNIIAGTQIALEVEGNNVIISNSAEGTKLINNLDQTAVGVGALDAAQGKVLKESIPEVINNLTTIDSKKALSAHQGYVLAGRSVPVGGGTGQVLMKSADDDYSLTWGDAADPNAIVGDGSIKKIVELTYDEYVALEEAGQLEDTTEYHISDMNEQGGTYITENEIQDMIDVSTDSLKTQINAVQSNVTTVQNTLNELVAQDVSTAVVPYNTDVAGLGGHSRLIKYGPVYTYQVSFSTGTALAANTSYTLATISSAHRPNIPSQSIQGVIRANNDTFVSFWISGGQVQIYPTTTIPSGANLAGSFSWTNL